MLYCGDYGTEKLLESFRFEGRAAFTGWYNCSSLKQIQLGGMGQKPFEGLSFFCQ
uniref:Uncharacterized protein n=1 Tax=Anguilla anguilla TaxID=7936 RepID=A0A0E9WSH8_ANGAN